MTPEQINAVYYHLCRKTDRPDEFLRQLDAVNVNWDPVEAVLYLPMYSMGIGQAGITPRIRALRSIPFTVPRVVSGQIPEQQIERLGLEEGKQFGMIERIRELFERANQISNYGETRLRATLGRRTDWSLDDFVDPFTLLYRFTGIADKAALHILMDIGWNVVKPDRHICRFLSRLGGPWIRYFPNGPTTELRAALTLPFVKDWRDFCTAFATSTLPPPTSRDGVEFPPVSNLSSRQVDILIMWFAQDRAKAEQSWRPKPVCGKQPACQECSVPDCKGRMRPAAPNT